MNKKLSNLFKFAALIVILATITVIVLTDETPKLITEDELPEGYILQVETEDSVRISHGPYLIKLGQVYETDKGTEIKFCGISDSEEIYLSVDNGDLVVLTGSAAEIQNTDFYISYKNLANESISIRWSVDLQKSESIMLSSGQILTFVEFVDSTPMFKLE
ncbi:MAG: hypothetical protein KAI67_04190 [Candidatus Pacebacteria bacterium]|nr:hypothetical protein [Candidatus Paceibacterota bacterium]